MQSTSSIHPEIKPFAFQNRTVYRDLLRLIMTVKEIQSTQISDLGKTFMHELFNGTNILSKYIAHVYLVEINPIKIDIVARTIGTTVDVMNALDICFEAKWIPAIQYFEAKQILEKTYWFLKDEQRSIHTWIQTNTREDCNNSKQFQ